MVITFQPAEQGGVLPYPFHVRPDGRIQRQDVWRGDPFRVIGFVSGFSDLAVDLEWVDAVVDPQRAVGMFMVASDEDGRWSTYSPAIGTVIVRADA
jgi:hypothetical protein